MALNERIAQLLQQGGYKGDTSTPEVARSAFDKIMGMGDTAFRTRLEQAAPNLYQKYQARPTQSTGQTGATSYGQTSPTSTGARPTSATGATAAPTAPTAPVTTTYQNIPNLTDLKYHQDILKTHTPTTTQAQIYENQILGQQANWDANVVAQGGTPANWKPRPPLSSYGPITSTTQVEDPQYTIAQNYMAPYQEYWKKRIGELSPDVMSGKLDLGGAQRLIRGEIMGQVPIPTTTGY